MYKQLSFLLVLCVLAYTGLSQPSAPILRFELGMHTAAGKRVSSDAEGKYFLSCSNDKTARLWDSETGQLLKIFRVPIGSTNEGKLYCCALSPKGNIAALAGWTGDDWDNSFSIYIVNTFTGEISSRLMAGADVVFDLEFSKDGKYLAAGCGGATGVRVYNVANLSLLKKLDGYGDDVYNVAFDSKNRLATVSDDGTIRLYDNKFFLIKKEDRLAGKQPYSLAFSPDDSKIAVGYDDNPAIEVRDAETLELLYSPEMGTMDENGGLDVLSFSGDGKYLYGGGSTSDLIDGKSLNYLRIWKDEGRGSYSDLHAFDNTIMDIKPLPGGKMVIIGSAPEIVYLDKNNSIIWQIKGEINDYSSSNKSHFKASDNGTNIGFTPYGEDPLIFDVTSRSIRQGTSTQPTYTDQSAGIKVTEWKNSYQPYINSKAVGFLEDNETSRCTDIANDGTVIIGADWHIYRTNSAGEKIWSIPVPGNARAVKITTNKKMVVAALRDGTIRWYKLSDGTELLAFYLHPDKKRWALFTPGGYYDVSPGAEEMLGWHFNNGPDKRPDFYPISRFKEKYYRPDIVDAVLETYSENEAITLANLRSNKTIVPPSTDLRKKLPPTVTIASPMNGSSFSNNTVRISYTLNAPADAPVKNTRILVNGRPVPAGRGVITAASGEKTVDIIVPSENVTITLLAENDNGTSPAATLFLKWAAPSVAKDEFIYKPKLYVLAVGVSKYNNASFNLNFAAKDAMDFISTLEKQKGALYSDVIVKKLVNQDATKDNLTDGLDWIQRMTGQKDLAMIFFAGHGVNDNNGLFYMLPVGADMERIRTTCLNFEELKQTVSSIAGKVVVFIDACHSGNVMGSTRRGNVDINSLVNELSNTENGAITFTSSTGKEFSLEDQAWGNGAFTKALIEGLNGKAAINGKNKITIKSLDAYVSERVKEITNGKQHPTSVTPPNVPDFPIGITQ